MCGKHVMIYKVHAIALILALLAGCAGIDLDNHALEGSPKLGVAFFQDGSQKVIRSNNGVATVALTRPNFAMLVPSSNKAVQVCAGDSAAIFTVSGHGNPACFARGTGMALPKQAPEKGWTLQLSTGQAHNYYDTSRTVNGKRYRAVYLNEIKGASAAKEIFLSVFIDNNANREVDQEEVEHFVLAFPESVITVVRDKDEARRRTDKEIQTVFSNNKNLLYQIYLDELKRNPGLGGKLVLKFTILPSGKVKGVSIVSSTLSNMALEEEISTRVGELDFGGGNVKTVTIIYPLLFLPNR